MTATCWVLLDWSCDYTEDRVKIVERRLAENVSAKYSKMVSGTIDRGYDVNPGSHSWQRIPIPIDGGIGRGASDYNYCRP